MTIRNSGQELIESRRDFLVKALSLGYLAGGLGWHTQALASLFGSIPGKLPEGRSIFDFSGDVQVDGKPATKETLIGPASRVTTGRNSYVIAAVGSNAFIIRDQSVVDMGGGNPVKTVLRLLTGKMLGVFGKLEATRSLSVNTPTATIGIRGTGVYAEADAEKTYLCTCYGTTELVAQADYAGPAAAPKAPPADAKTKKSGKVVAPAAAPAPQGPAPEIARVTAMHHDAPKYILANPEKGSRIIAAPFVNHTDLELMTLEALVGRKVPFGLPDQQYEGPRRDY